MMKMVSVRFESVLCLYIRETATRNKSMPGNIIKIII